MGPEGVLSLLVVPAVFTYIDDLEHLLGALKALVVGVSVLVQYGDTVRSVKDGVGELAQNVVAPLT